jgi:hypothetical protein
MNIFSKPILLITTLPTTHPQGSGLFPGISFLKSMTAAS